MDRLLASNAGPDLGKGRDQSDRVWRPGRVLVLLASFPVAPTAGPGIGA